MPRRGACKNLYSKIFLTLVKTCGYIATLGAIASGALVCYIPETGMSLEMVAEDVRFLKQRYQADAKGKSEGRLVIRSEKSSKVYSTDVLTDILTDEGGDTFDARSVKLGHTLQGGVPTPRDRTRATRLAVRSVQFIERHAADIKHFPILHNDKHSTQELQKEAHDIATIVIQGAQLRFASLQEMRDDADMKMRRGKNEWWLQLSPLVALLGGRQDLVENAKSLGSILASDKVQRKEKA
jgi:6-phosphofructokinase 1